MLDVTQACAVCVRVWHTRPVNRATEETLANCPYTHIYWKGHIFAKLPSNIEACRFHIPFRCTRGAVLSTAYQLRNVQRHSAACTFYRTSCQTVLANGCTITTAFVLIPFSLYLWRYMKCCLGQLSRYSNSLLACWFGNRIPITSIFS